MSNIDTLEQQIARQQEKLKQLKAQKQAVIARQKAQEKKLTRQQDTRRKILAGSYVLDLANKEEANKQKFMIGIDKYLTRDDDRALFDLPPLVQSQQLSQQQISENDELTV